MTTLRQTALAAATLSVFLPNLAHAEFKVHSPLVEEGEVEVEHGGSISTDRRAARDNEQSYVASIGYGVSSHWATELEGEWGRDAGPGQSREFKATNWSNRFQFFKQGETWLDLGLMAEYGMASKATDADTVKFGPLLQKSFGPTTTTLNLLLEKQVGANAVGGADFSYATQVRWDLTGYFAPAIEAFGDLGEVNRTHAVSNQQHRIGPVATGKLALGEAGELKYEVGYLRGLTNATADNTYKWLIEYEKAF